MAALDNFRINDPNFQNTADELANRAYWEGRDRGLSHLDALKAMEKGPMGLNRDLLSVTGTKGDMHGYVGKSIRDSVLRYKPERLLPPPAQAAPALTPSHLTGTKMGSAPQPALQTGAYAPELPVNDVERPLTEAQKHARLTEPAVTMFTGADGNLYPAGHPMLTQQDAILSDNTAALPTVGETRDNRRSGIMMNQDPARYAPDGSSLVGNPYATDEGALASVTTGSDGSGSNRLTNLLSGLSRDAIGFAKDVIANGISVTYNGNEIFAVDRQGDTARIDEGTAAAINDANNSSTEQDPSQQNPPMGMSFNAGLAQPPALTTPNENGTVVTQTPQTDNGALTAPVSAKPTQSTVRSTTGGYTGNARGSALPDMQIGLNERLMRMGAAGLAAGGQGSLAQMGAMFGASADVNQANRQAEMEAFGIEEERRQAHAARVAALAASKNKGANAETVAAASSARIALDNANDVLKGFDDFDGVTGPFNWFVSGWDSSGFGDAGRANVRLKISKMKVDSTLARIAQTKGAISEKEMEIFASDQPSFYASEDVWREWVTNYIRALKIMNTNLSTGQTPYKNGGGGASNDQETEDLVKKYTN